MRELPQRLASPLEVLRGSAATPVCPACGKPVRYREHAVALRGDSYHPGCALYGRPRRPA